MKDIWKILALLVAGLAVAALAQAIAPILPLPTPWNSAIPTIAGLFGLHLIYLKLFAKK